MKATSKIQSSKCIGLWACSSPSPTKDIKKGLKRLKELSIKYKLPSQSQSFASRSLSSTQKFLAGPDSLKIKAFVSLINDRSINQIFAIRGGYGALRLLPLLDKIELPTQHPTLWGYSDLTVIQNYLFLRTKQPWVHSPMLSSASFHTPTKREVKFWEKTLIEPTSIVEFKVQALHLETHQSKQNQKGLLLGGNLASLVSMMGTPWNPRWQKGSYLFLEEISEAPYRLERLLIQLSYHHDFKKLSGIILGHFTQCPKALSLIKTWAQEKRISIWSKIPSGHESPHFPIVLGDVVHIKKNTQKDFIITLPKPRFGC